MAPPPPVGATPAPLMDLYRQMALIRAFEQRVAELYRDGDIPGFVHTSLGQEAVAVGVGAVLADEDYMATTHRGHGHCLAKGMGVDEMMAELFAKANGICAGKGGSMHIADPARGVLGANAIVGASLPITVGAGLSSKLLGQGRVAVAFFGDGAVNNGQFHEAVNLAAIWDLPVLFVCENNLYAEFTSSATMSRVPEIATRAAAYGIDAARVDGNDVEAVFEVAGAARRACLEGRGPFLIEALTYRWHGHYEGDAQSYKPEDEVAEWRARDPLTIARDRLLASAAAGESELGAVLAETTQRVEASVERARGANPPEPADAFDHVFVAAS